MVGDQLRIANGRTDQNLSHKVRKFNFLAVIGKIYPVPRLPHVASISRVHFAKFSSPSLILCRVLLFGEP